MSSRSLQNYIMPYAMTALFSEKMLKVASALCVLEGRCAGLCICLLTVSMFPQYENVTSASIEVLGAVCRCLTWSKYLYYLKHFIHVLQTGQAEQKLAVRQVSSCVGWALAHGVHFPLTDFSFPYSLLVIVLDAFHFDHQTMSKEIEAAKSKEADGK